MRSLFRHGPRNLSVVRYVVRAGGYGEATNGIKDTDLTNEATRRGNVGFPYAAATVCSILTYVIAHNR